MSDADGFRIVVNAEAWRGGSQLIEEIDRPVHPAIVACGRHGIGGLEEPPKPPPEPTTYWGSSL